MLALPPARPAKDDASAKAPCKCSLLSHSQSIHKNSMLIASRTGRSWRGAFCFAHRGSWGKATHSTSWNRPSKKPTAFGTRISVSGAACNTNNNNKFDPLAALSAKRHPAHVCFRIHLNRRWNSESSFTHDSWLGGKRIAAGL